MSEMTCTHYNNVMEGDQMALKVVFPLPLPPKALPEDLFRTFDIEIDALIDAPKARSSFDVNGNGLSVSVLDTGLRLTHRCFEEC